FLHFGPRFLFVEGDGNNRHRVLGMGEMYFWELPFWLLGLIVCLRLNPKTRNVILWWIIIAPIPAALSVPSPHALRSLNILPMPQIIVGLGLLATYFYLKQRQRLIFAGALTVIIIFYFVRYLFLYYAVTAKVASPDWADGYKELTTYVFSHEQNYSKVI